LPLRPCGGWHGRCELSGPSSKNRDADAKPAAILDAAVDGIITIDEHGAVKSFNWAAERIFGYARGICHWSASIGATTSASLPKAMSPILMRARD
jgi:nitrogen fixation/metabolism regulation signal transduction histidine kinase